MAGRLKQKCPVLDHRINLFHFHKYIIRLPTLPTCIPLPFSPPPHPAVLSADRQTEPYHDNFEKFSDVAMISTSHKAGAFYGAPAKLGVERHGSAIYTFNYHLYILKLFMGQNRADDATCKKVWASSNIVHATLQSSGFVTEQCLIVHQV